MSKFDHTLDVFSVSVGPFVLNLSAMSYLAPYTRLDYHEGIYLKQQISTISEVDPPLRDP